MTDSFAERVLARRVAIGVVGLGYVGLPLAMAFARNGYRVVGVDVSEDVVRALCAGRSPIMDVPSEEVREHVESQRFQATLAYELLADVDVVFVCVPTPFDRAKAPDLSYVVAAASSLARVLRSGQLVILESTTYPGTTEEVLIGILEGSGLHAGVDFFVAFSPERIDPGNKFFTIANTPKVVGGIDAESTDRAALVLQQVVRDGGVHRVSSPRVAELTKLLENTFRAVNIALVNELTLLCDRMGIDIWEVIEAASTKPYGFMPFYPGPGVGGHCIPVDPYFLSWKAREFDFHTKFIELAAETNSAMPFFTVDRIRKLLNEVDRPLHGARVFVLGAAFKRGVDDWRNSAAVKVMEILRTEGAEVSYHDPFVAEVALSPSLFARGPGSIRLRSVLLEAARMKESDCVAILVGHSSIDYQLVIDSASLVFDAVNATKGLRGKAVVERL